MAGKMKKALIFDLDGTLCDSIASIRYCVNRALGDFGYGPFSEQQCKYFAGDGAAALVRRALAAGGDAGLVHFEEAYPHYREIFRENCMYEVKPYQGIPELIAELKERGVKIAVLSNKPHAETVDVIETLFGRECFDHIQGQIEGLAIKPSPEGVFLILKEMELAPEDVLYLGDTATDMKTGKGAGAFTVGALWGFRDASELRDGGADVLVEHPLEVLKFL